MTGTEKRDAQGLANIAANIPARLDPSGESVQIGVRVSQATAAKLDLLRGDTSRAAYVRELLEQHLSSGSSKNT